MLLLATAFARQIRHVRFGFAAAAALALPTAFFASPSPVYVVIVAAILLVNLGLLVQELLGDKKIHFSAEEQELRRLHFVGLGPSAARRLIDQGHWISARRGEVLICENQAASSLFYLAEGEATVQREGVDVGIVSGGALIGEATVLDGGQATGTVMLAGNARLWFVPAEALRSYLAANPAIAASLHQGFARALRGKLANANARIADRPPLT